MLLKETFDHKKGKRSKEVEQHEKEESHKRRQEVDKWQEKQMQDPEHIAILKRMSGI